LIFMHFHEVFLGNSTKSDRNNTTEKSVTNSQVQGDMPDTRVNGTSADAEGTGLVYSLIGHQIGYSTHRRCPDAYTRDFSRGPLARSSQSD
jgi:hypothetical protein